MFLGSSRLDIKTERRDYVNNNTDECIFRTRHKESSHFFRSFYVLLHCSTCGEQGNSCDARDSSQVELVACAMSTRRDLAGRAGLVLLVKAIKSSKYTDRPAVLQVTKRTRRCQKGQFKAVPGTSRKYSSRGREENTRPRDVCGLRTFYRLDRTSPARPARSRRVKCTVRRHGVRRKL